MIPIMLIETTATVSEQITGNSSRTATTAARPLILFLCAKRLSLSETQSCWQLISNRAMLLPYARGL
jgi:hypothetical protein